MFQYEKSLKSASGSKELDSANNPNGKLAKELLNVQEIVEKVENVPFNLNKSRFNQHQSRNQTIQVCFFVVCFFDLFFV